MGLKSNAHARVWMLSVAVLAASGLGCNDNSTAVGFPPLDVELVKPFDFDWDGKEDGAVFLAQQGRFSARANARVYWKMRITGVPQDPSDPRYTWAHGVGPPLFTWGGQDDIFQEEIFFSWRPNDVFPGRSPFARGDTCTAVLRYTPFQFDTDEEQQAVLRFVIGGGVLEEEEPTPP